MSQSEPTRVMIGVNESSIKGYPHPSISSRRAFDWTLQKIIRDNIPGFKLLFLHVQVPDEDGFNDMDSIYASPDDFKDLKNQEKKKGLHLLEYFVRKSNELGIACEAWLRKGDPKEVICHEVTRVRPDLLVVGCRGLGPFQRAYWDERPLDLYRKGLYSASKLAELSASWMVFVGTVSEFCVKHAECPVITIKREAGETPQDPVDD